MTVEEEFEDVLQNIETAIVGVQQDHPALTDYAVMNALEALIDAYDKELSGRPPRTFRLSAEETELVEAMRSMCEWRLGRGEPAMREVSGEALPTPEPLTVEEIILCLKRLLKSVKHWNKRGGQRGYLDFINQFIR